LSDSPFVWSSIDKKELALIRRAEIDADLSQMAQDTEYQAEVLQMEAEFAIAQWEALQTIENAGCWCG
jgi:hypothetical protein